MSRYANSESARVLEQEPIEYKVAHDNFQNVEMIPSNDPRQWRNHLDFMADWEEKRYGFDYKNIRDINTPYLLLVEITVWRQHGAPLPDKLNGSIFGTQDILLQQYDQGLIGYDAHHIREILQPFVDEYNHTKKLPMSKGAPIPYTSIIVTKNSPLWGPMVANMFQIPIRDIRKILVIKDEKNQL